MIATNPMHAHKMYVGAVCVAGAFFFGLPDAAAAPLRADVQLVDFKREPASEDAMRMAQWVLDSGNNAALPFMIIDKKNAKAFAFDATGQLRGATAVLLGAAIGDDSVADIGNRPLSSIRLEERTTPAGRFVAVLDYDLDGQEILWVDYANAIALHRLVTGNPLERRAQRLATSAVGDKRISYGCINVPPKFFDQVVLPIFRNSKGIVYILPETRPLGAVFSSFDRYDKLRHGGVRLNQSSSSPVTDEKSGEEMKKDSQAEA